VLQSSCISSSKKTQQKTCSWTSYAIIVSFGSFLIVFFAISGSQAVLQGMNAEIVGLLKNEQQNPIFVIGDSRSYHGLDCLLLEDLTSRQVITFAKHGAGVYDMTVNAEFVPIGSTVILSPSCATMVRPKSRDKNRSGISITCLQNLYFAGYSFNECAKIISNNWRIYHPVGRTKTKIYDYSSTPNTKWWPLFEARYSHSKPVAHYETKWTVFEKLIDLLKSKQCQVILVEFPISERLHELRNQSAYKSFTERLKRYQCDQVLVLSGIKLDAEKNPFYDDSHLNEYGRELATRWIYDHAFREKNSSNVAEKPERLEQK